MTVVYSPIKVRVENGEILDVENVLYLDADECTKRAMHLSKNGSGLWSYSFLTKSAKLKQWR